LRHLRLLLLKGRMPPDAGDGSSAAASPFRSGEAVHVFYRMDVRCDRHRKYVAALDANQGAYRPRSGLSDGWVPARVTEDQREDGGEVCIEYAWPHFYTKQGRIADDRTCWTECFPLADVRRSTELSKADSIPDALVAPGFQPDLALLVFRWGGINEISHCEQWGETGTSSSDTFLKAFLESAVRPKLGTNYEVWTVYIEDHSDMIKVAQMAHLAFGAHHPVRRARRACAMYLLYPTAFEEGCVPTMETGGDKGAGLVDRQSFFQMMKSVERAGIPTRFPHCSGLYEQLASKSWTSVLSLTPHLRLPATVAVPRMLIEQSCAEAASRALKALQLVRKQQILLRGGNADQCCPIEKGVAKLGFSWEALDVKYWQRGSGLQAALEQLAKRIEISGELTAQPHDLEEILVQEYVPHDLEIRVYIVQGQVEGIIYTKFCRIKENMEFGDFKQQFSKAEAARQWMGGDAAALDDAERQCRELSGHWLDWFQAQSCEVPVAIRADFFAGRTAKQGCAEVWSLELCELGFSMLAHKSLPGKVFAAMLDGCLKGPAHEGLEAGQQLPESKRYKPTTPA